MPGEIVFSSSTIRALVTGELFLVDVAQMISPAELPDELFALHAKHISVAVSMRPRSSQIINNKTKYFKLRLSRSSQNINNKTKYFKLRLSVIMLIL